jgi:hypothetical protein
MSVDFVREKNMVSSASLHGPGWPGRCSTVHPAPMFRSA